MKLIDEETGIVSIKENKYLIREESKTMKDHYVLKFKLFNEMVGINYKGKDRTIVFETEEQARKFAKEIELWYLIVIHHPGITEYEDYPISLSKIMD